MNQRKPFTLLSAYLELKEFVIAQERKERDAMEKLSDPVREELARIGAQQPGDHA